MSNRLYVYFLKNDQIEIKCLQMSGFFCLSCTGCKQLSVYFGYKTHIYLLSYVVFGRLLKDRVYPSYYVTSFNSKIDMNIFHTHVEFITVCILYVYIANISRSKNTDISQLSTPGINQILMKEWIPIQADDFVYI